MRAADDELWLRLRHAASTYSALLTARKPDETSIMPRSNEPLSRARPRSTSEASASGMESDRPTVATSGDERSIALARSNHTSSEAIIRHQRQSDVIKGPSGASITLARSTFESNQEQSIAIKSNQEQSREINSNQ
jgi:hypothetical protein